MTKLISFCINTAVNELQYLQLLIKSLRDNLSTLDHEIIVFIDSDNEDTFNWLLEQKQTLPNLKILKNPLPVCYGYARNINEMFEFATNDIVSYLQSDMVISKGYDLDILKHIQPGTVLSSTRIEPPLHGNGPEKHTVDFGLSPDEFKYEEFLKYCTNNKQDRTSNYFFAPFTMYKEVWNSIGGHDTQFRRSREDSDILNRLILNGTEIIQTWDALVYHFTCVSSRGKDWFNKDNKQAQTRAALQQEADQIEMFRFLRKWGNFSHGEPLRYYYKVSAQINIDTDNLSNFNLISSFFDNTYINSQELYDKYVSQDEHKYANQLLDFNEDDWKKYSYMYRTEDLKNKIHLGEPEGEVVVSFNLSGVDNDTYNEIINKLQHIVHNYEQGEYEYKGFNILIKSKANNIHSKIKAVNPKVEEEHKFLVL